MVLHRIGGAGNKVNRITLGEVDSYIAPFFGLGSWDICASEALIRAMGGVVTNLEGERLSYDEPKQPPFVVAKSANLHN